MVILFRSDPSRSLGVGSRVRSPRGFWSDDPGPPFSRGRGVKGPPFWFRVLGPTNRKVFGSLRRLEGRTSTVLRHRKSEESGPLHGVSPSLWRVPRTSFSWSDPGHVSGEFPCTSLYRGDTWHRETDGQVDGVCPGSITTDSGVRGLSWYLPQVCPFWTEARQEFRRLSRQDPDS